jgi:hypothetical protein
MRLGAKVEVKNNEYITAEDNERINRDSFLSAQEQMDLEEKELEESLKEIESAVHEEVEEYQEDDMPPEDEDDEEHNEDEDPEVEPYDNFEDEPEE